MLDADKNLVELGRGGFSVVYHGITMSCCYGTDYLIRNAVLVVGCCSEANYIHR